MSNFKRFITLALACLTVLSICSIAFASGSDSNTWLLLGAQTNLPPLAI